MNSILFSTERRLRNAACEKEIAGGGNRSDLTEPKHHHCSGTKSRRSPEFPAEISCVGNEYISSGFLPEHCLHVSMNAEERRFVIWNPDLRADVIYRDTEYLDFPLPRLVFGLRVLADGRVADCSMGVVADEPPTADTVVVCVLESYEVYQQGRQAA